MKLGLGLYRHMLTRENFLFARQAGATHIVAHLVDYFKGGAKNPRDNQPTGTERGWGLAGDPNKLWSAEELIGLRKNIEAEGLKLEAIENFDPAHWHDVLLDGPQKKAQFENVKTIIRNLGKAGIPIMGYNFSIAGVCGRTHQPYARGGAMSVGMGKARLKRRCQTAWRGTWSWMKTHRKEMFRPPRRNNYGGGSMIFCAKSFPSPRSRA